MLKALAWSTVVVEGQHVPESAVIPDNTTSNQAVNGRVI